MLKIAVFGFYAPDQTRVVSSNDYISPVDTEDFMRIVWQIEPTETRIGVGGTEVPCFVKLTQLASQPVYVQSLSNRMAPGAALLNCDGYVAIIDAVKILAPKTIQNTLRRLSEQHPQAHLIIAAGRQNEPEALSSDEIRQILGLHVDLPIYPFVPTESKTVARLIKRLARYIDDPKRLAPPIFAGEVVISVEDAIPTAVEVALPKAPARPRIYELAHVAITISDLNRSLDFYRGLLGFRLLGQIDFPDDTTGKVVTQLDTGRGVIELFSYTNPPAQAAPDTSQMPIGLRHLALRVGGLDLIVEQLMCAGVEFTLEPTEAAGGIRHAVLLDPDGIAIELIEGDVVYSRR
ncbi:MAG TPA: VOC family protein [Aggregatilineaceae bacterium]|nr:VOC family protein [Aggregatilineaceae bacterium]